MDNLKISDYVRGQIIDSTTGKVVGDSDKIAQIIEKIKEEKHEKVKK